MNEIKKLFLQSVIDARSLSVKEYPIYYAEKDLLIREDEDGSKYIVTFDENKKEHIIGKYNGK